jgi:hypothetical protein
MGRVVAGITALVTRWRFAAFVVPLLVALGLVAAFWLVGHLAATGTSTFDWNAAAAAATAYGTLALALATGGLVASTREDVSGTLKLARLAERERDATIIPCVYPYFNRHWVNETSGHLRSFPFQNGASGIALNVTGHLYYPSGDRALSSTTLAPGDSVWIEFRGEVPSWDEIYGYVTYLDILERRWETRFMISMGPDERIRPMICQYGLAEKLESRAYPAGWEMSDGSPRLELP